MSENKKAVNWLISGHLITDLYSGFLTPLMPFIAMKIGFSLAVATLIMSISQVISSTVQPLFGYLADTNKKRFFIFWGLIISALAYPLAANASVIWVFFLFEVLGNLGGSLYHPQALGFVTKFSDTKTIYNMSIFVTAGTVGFAIGPIVSSTIAQKFGYQYLLLTALIGIITALLMFKFVPKTSTAETQKVNKNFNSAIKDIIKNKIMLILLTIGLMKSLIQSSCSIMMPFLWRDMGYEPMYIGFAMFLFLFAGGLGSYYSHEFEKIFGAKFVFYSSMIVTFPLMGLYALTYKEFPMFALMIFVIIGFLTTFAQPVTLVMAQKTMPQYKSIVSGIINGFTWGIVATVLIALSSIAEKIGIIPILTALSVLPAISSVLIKHLPDNIE